MIPKRVGLAELGVEARANEGSSLVPGHGTLLSFHYSSDVTRLPVLVAQHLIIGFRVVRTPHLFKLLETGGMKVPITLPRFPGLVVMADQRVDVPPS